MNTFFNFTFDNQFGMLLALIPALLNFGILFYILFYLPKNGICYAFSLFVGSLAIWQTSEAITRISATVETAALWNDILIFGSLLMIPAGLHFTLLFTEKKKYATSPPLIFFLYFPVCLFISLNSTTDTITSMYHHPVWGWVVKFESSLLISVIGIWVSIQAITMLILLFNYAIKVRHNREKFYQSILIACGFLVPTIQGMITEVIFPTFLKIPQIPIASTFFSVFSITTLIALTRFKLFKISPSIASGTILESIKDIVIIVNPDERLEFINAKGARILEINDKIIETLCLKDLFPRDTIFYEHFIRDVWYKVIKGEYPENYNTMFLKQDNLEIPVSVSAVPIPVTINYQTLPSVLLVARDITIQKKSEDELKKSESKNRALLNAMPDLIFTISKEGVFLDYHDVEANKILLPPEMFLGKSICEVMPDISGQVMFNINQALMTNEIQTFEYKVTINDVVSEREARAVASGDDEVIMIIRDITEKKRMESQFLRAQRLESIGTLTAGIAHDLNNALTPIMMSVEILRMNLPEKKREEVLLNLESSVKRGSDIIKQLLIFARGEIDKEHTNIQINQLISNISQIINSTFPKSIKLVTSVAENLWSVSGDITLLEQMLLNLCVNARDAMPDGGTLTITAENIIIDDNPARINIDALAGPYVSIEVIDTGVGMPSEITDKIFEPFFTTKEMGKGTGLGLSTTSGIIKNHGGFVNLYSEVGKGTMFKVFIPTDKSVKI